MVMFATDCKYVFFHFWINLQNGKKLFSFCRAAIGRVELGVEMVLCLCAADVDGPMHIETIQLVLILIINTVKQKNSSLLSSLLRFRSLSFFA